MANRLIEGILTEYFKGVVRTSGYAFRSDLLSILQILPCFLVGYYVSTGPWDADAFRRS
jgi:hypothetical protein